MSNHAVQAKSYSNKQLRQYTLKMMKKHHLRGSIEIVKNGHAQRVSLGYGYYSKRLKNGNTKLLYPVGSLQKMVTAAIITQLIYQKKFNQNTKISRWYPNLKHANQITVGQLMTHTSGINVIGTESIMELIFLKMARSIGQLPKPMHEKIRDAVNLITIMLTMFCWQALSVK